MDFVFSLIVFGGCKVRERGVYKLFADIEMARPCISGSSLVKLQMSRWNMLGTNTACRRLPECKVRAFQ